MRVQRGHGLRIIVGPLKYIKHEEAGPGSASAVAADTELYSSKVKLKLPGRIPVRTSMYPAKLRDL